MAGRAGRLIVAATMLVLVAAGCSSVEDAASAQDIEADPQVFAAMAQGVSVGEEIDSEVFRLRIDLIFLNGTLPFQTLEVDKVLDMTTFPFDVRDGIYILTDADEDTLTLLTEGVVTPPGPPDGFFTRALESWVVTGGTGKWEGASGRGEVYSAVVVQGLMAETSPVVKYFTGTIVAPNAGLLTTGQSG